MEYPKDLHELFEITNQKGYHMMAKDIEEAIKKYSQMVKEEIEKMDAKIPKYRLDSYTTATGLGLRLVKVES